MAPAWKLAALFAVSSVVSLGILGYFVSFNGREVSGRELEWILATYGALIAATGPMELIGSRASLLLVNWSRPALVHFGAVWERYADAYQQTAPTDIDPSARPLLR